MVEVSKMRTAKHVVLEINADLTESMILAELLSVIAEIRESLGVKFPFRNITVTDKTVHQWRVP
jgi:hypothetical protein